MDILRPIRSPTIFLLALFLTAQLPIVAAQGSQPQLQPQPSLTATINNNSSEVWSLTRQVLVSEPLSMERRGRLEPWSHDETEKRAKRAKEHPRHLQLPMRKHWVAGNGATGDRMAKRYAPSSARSLGGWCYLVDLQVGTPGQNIPVLIDTAYWELILNPTCDRTVKPAPTCAQWPAYDPSKSISYSDTTRPFRYDYGAAGGFLRGSWIFDDVTYAGYKISHIMLGLGNSSVGLDTAILGLGFGNGIATSHATLLDRLVADNFIMQHIFSLGLGSLDQSQSQLIFGGVDLSMFSGSLVQLPIEPTLANQQPNAPRYMVHLTDIGITIPNGTHLTAWYIADESFSEYVVLASSTLLSYLPQLIADRAIKALGGYQTSEGYFVDCAWLDKPGSFDFYFNDDGLEISVPWKDFLIQDGNKCKLGVAPITAPVLPQLGLTFMRGAYLVFDQVTKSVWMANYKQCADVKGHKYVDIDNAQTDLAKAFGIC